MDMPKLKILIFRQPRIVDLDPDRLILIGLVFPFAVGDNYGIFNKREIYNLCIDSIIDCEQDEQTKRWLVKKSSLIHYLQTNDIKREGCGWIRWKEGDKFALIRGYINLEYNIFLQRPLYQRD